ncbi:hypothetical protein [Paractinoplanes durhamensis]|uniref:Flavin reductase n=1 Tax=Paractinoplanes durhamensis TaxID=113563 RepID=A0ABQ3Z7Z7_9ACTN|nr:hypothetical protein [Actinoplanes durhamensis]GIE05960.1 hypothetical protein Adu01nite_73100 [Actinoplanes durhamensis]
MTDEAHLPKRPVWECYRCGAEWPCVEARNALAAEYVADQLALAILMWTYLEDFAMDAGPGPIGEAWNRFLGWTRRSSDCPP